MTRRLRSTIAAAALSVLPFAVTDCDTPAPVKSKPCQGNPVVVDWPDLPNCDLRPPQQLNVVFPAGMSEAAAKTRCREIGGTLTMHWLRFICTGVDY